MVRISGKNILPIICAVADKYGLKNYMNIS